MVETAAVPRRLCCECIRSGHWPRVRGRVPDPGDGTAQVRDLTTLITLAIISGLVLIALWLWMTRTNGQGKNWARILSTVLFSLATLELIKQHPGSRLGHFVLGGQAQPVIHYGSGVTVLALIVPALTWLARAAAVWLLWHPASSPFFKPQGLVMVTRAETIGSVPID